MPKQPQDRKKKYDGWKKTSTFELTLPSGVEVLVKRPGLQGLLKDGILDDLDSLTALVVTETIPKAEGKAAPKATLPDPKKLITALEAMDKIVVYCVQEPTVLPVPPEGEERVESDDEFYVDEIGIEDKSMIVAFAMGGSSDLEQFRAGSQAAVGSVPAGT